MNYGQKWIEGTFKVKCSPLGAEVADFLNTLADGIYHLDSNALKRADWANKDWITVNLYGRTLSTYDFDWLTRIVLLSHDRCLRVEINPVNFKNLQLMFHKRERDGNSISTRMPTMEKHIEDLREIFKASGDT